MSYKPADTGHGRGNKIWGHLANFAQITGGAAEADVVGNHFVLPSKAIFVGGYASGLTGADVTAAGIVVYQGTSKSGTAVSASADIGTAASSRLTAEIVPLAAVYGREYAKGTEFCCSENVTNTKKLDHLLVTLEFRAVEP